MNIGPLGRKALFGLCFVALATGAACKSDEATNSNTGVVVNTNRMATPTTMPAANTNTMSSTMSAEDTTIKNKAEAALSKAGITGVTVMVKNGEVTATGDVAAAKYTDAVKALNEAGAKKVTNNLVKK